MEGFLKRKVSFLKGYQEKWFVLSDDGILQQFENQPVDKNEAPKWRMIVVLADVVTKSDGIRFNLVSCDGSTVRLKGRNNDETTKWVVNLKKAASNDKYFKPNRRSSTNDDVETAAVDIKTETQSLKKEDDKEEELIVLDKEEIQKEMKERTIKSKRASYKKYLMVAAIDLGSAYSGSAFSLKSHFLSNPLKVCLMEGFNQSGIHESSKIPTVLLMDPQKNFLAFGNDAENMYANLVQNKPEYANQCYYFTRFKMQLYNNENLRKSMKLRDISGKNEMKAVDVFAASIEFMKMKTFQRAKEHISSLREADIHWVITVPAIWDEAARQFMIEAAEKADISRDKLTLALEPEAAALYCRNLEVKNHEHGNKSELSAFQTGAKFMVVDLGGGTVDITANEVLETGQLREISSASGGPWGGNMVNAKIWSILRGILGPEAIKKFMYEYRDDYLNLVRDIELRKRSVSSSEKFSLPIPFPLRNLVKEANPKMISDQYQGKAEFRKTNLRINAEVIMSIFNEGVEKIVGYIDSVLKKTETKGVSSILLVGGYASSDHLKESIQTKFSNLNVICPLKPDVAVLTGAVITGHMETPIVGRVAKHHYGIAIVSETEQQEFHTIIKKGQPIKVNDFVTEYDFPVRFQHQQEAFIKMYASDSDEPPVLITKDNCRKVGNIIIRLPQFKKPTKLKIGISNDETEFKVVARDENTGRCFVGSCRFLE